MLQGKRIACMLHSPRSPCDAPEYRAWLMLSVTPQTPFKSLATCNFFVSAHLFFLKFCFQGPIFFLAFTYNLCTIFSTSLFIIIISHYNIISNTTVKIIIIIIMRLWRQHVVLFLKKQLEKLWPEFSFSSSSGKREKNK